MDENLKAIFARAYSHRFVVTFIEFFSARATRFNIMGLLLYFPLLIAVGMSFDSPGSGRHWVHWFFVVTNVMLGPLCLIGLTSRSRRLWGLYGFGLFAIGCGLLGMVCGDGSGCR